jgi:hypothetical protein
LECGGNDAALAEFQVQRVLRQVSQSGVVATAPKEATPKRFIPVENALLI